MEIIRGVHNLKARHRGCVATIGNFDGVHHGHQMLLAHLAAKGRELDAAAVLVTFEPMPWEFFGSENAPARLTAFHDKMRALQQESELDAVLCLRFDARLAEWPADEVIQRLLVDALGVRYLVVGDDFRFGRGREGDYALLARAGDRLGFGVSHMGTLTFEHERVSSSRIREVLAAGNLAAAERLLGRPFALSGRVIAGRRLARQIGTPTANIRLHRNRPPLQGVFAVQVNGLPDGQVGQGVANIGFRPTVDGVEPMLEVHVLDYAGDLYGRRLEVVFRSFLRGECRFDGIDALTAQIRRDVAAARAWFADARSLAD